ncbi:ABC transporter ATP-binding protein [Minwuia sp.]|uniref:ABC transporter ATP-binding protein n=1 Tax=Minwuia sp. TaxID=2493630 RepID=UPI003A8D5592
MISVRVTEKGFGSEDRSTPVLGDIAFDLAAGETLAIFGRSGVGKTTLLRLLADLDRQFEGQITGVEGRIGHVFQSPRLLPWRTALQNLAIVAPEQPEGVLRALLARAGVPDAADMYPAQLSLGMARRVAIARALAVEPEVLLLDEPFASLDGDTARRLRGSLKELLNQITIPAVIVTHDPAEALELADRIIVLGGKPATVVLDRPAADLTVTEIAASVADS